VAERAECFAGSFSEAGADSCTLCPPNSFSDKNAGTCTCQAGYYPSGSGHTLECLRTRPLARACARQVHAC